VLTIIVPFGNKIRELVSEKESELKYINSENNIYKRQNKIK